MECNNTTLKYILTPDERKRLRELSKRSDINITNADKNGSVVIQEVKNYIKAAERQLDDKEYYKMLDSNPSETRKKWPNSWST